MIVSPAQLQNQSLNVLCGKPFCHRLIAEKQHDFPEDSRFILGKLEPDLMISDSHHRTPLFAAFHMPSEGWQDQLPHRNG